MQTLWVLRHVLPRCYGQFLPFGLTYVCGVFLKELREWASETGSLDRDQIVRALVGSEADPVAAEQYVQVSQ